MDECKEPWIRRRPLGLCSSPSYTTSLVILSKSLNLSAFLTCEMRVHASSNRFCELQEGTQPRASILLEDLEREES